MQLIEKFLLSHSSLVQKMENCSYGYSSKYPNLHHLEENIWTHTKSAYQHAINNSTSKYVKYAILVHDLGRLYTKEREKKTKKANFGHYEGVSVFASLDILHKFSLTKDEISRVIKIISYQYLIIDYIKYDNPSYETLLSILKYENDTLKDLIEYTKCDIAGRTIDKSVIHLYTNNKLDFLINNMKEVDFAEKETVVKPFNAYILVGPPCSRKSTWVSKRDSNHFIVSRDDCEEKIGEKYGITNYDDAYKFMRKHEHIKKEINQLEQQQMDEASAGKQIDIIIDNPNMEIKKRKFWIRALRKTHNIKVIVFLTPLETLFECNKNRSLKEKKSIHISVVLTKLKLFHMPLLSEGMDSIEYIFNGFNEN
jgi:predicted kinase